MKVLILSITVFASSVGLAAADTFGTGDYQFQIDFLPILGDASSANGTNISQYASSFILYKTFNDPGNFRIGVYEINNDQWLNFVNSYGAVTGTPSTAYDADPYYWPDAEAPTHFVSWYEAAQFVNWLNTNTGHHPAYKFTGTQGQADYTYAVWEPGDSGYDPNNPFRNTKSYYFLPTEDEWVKAAYWNGTMLQTYATKAGDTLRQGDGVTGTGWNYYDNGYATYPFGPWDVGSGSEELNGTYDIMGNVWELLESPFYPENYLFDASHGLRGGCYEYYGTPQNIGTLDSSHRFGISASGEDLKTGFRVASIFSEPVIIKPNGGEEIVAGSEYKIEWLTSAVFDPNVTIGYSINNGRDWIEVINIPNTGSHAWTVPYTTSNQCLIRITGQTDLNYTDTSANLFTIYECQYLSPADLDKDCYVNLSDFALLANEWLKCGNPFDDCMVLMVWKDINDPGVTGHEAFNGQMSKYETMNIQFCRFLNKALASGDIVVGTDDIVYGANGSNGGLDFVGMAYYDLTGTGRIFNGAINGGAARINWTGNSFTVDPGFENHPVTYVSWYGATAFAGFYGWRLPNEWEWQAVADYNGTFLYGCGTSINNNLANYRNSIHPDGTTEVGAFGSYGYEMCDMAGNVYEWTSADSVIRGGGWVYEDWICSVSLRGIIIQSSMSCDIGFRVCR